MQTRIRSAVLVAFGLLLAACGKDTQTPPATPPVTSANIDRERLLAADSEPQNWLTGGRDFGKSHHSPLRKIDRSTVKRLGFAWDYPTHTNRGLEATPIIVDGVLYSSGVAGRVYALNAKDGTALWTFDPKVDPQINRVVCCDAVNRGVAVWKGVVYVAALDGRLFALRAQTGDVIWSVDTIIDHKRGYSSTGAPEIAGNVVVIGNAGAEFDARGYVSAYTLDGGKLVWRFFTVPGDPTQPFEHPELEMAAKTWDPKSRWDVGGGATAWDGMVYDPQLNLLYVGTGNSALYNQAERSPSGGDNLFVSSILAINPDSGRLAWHYQETPGDQWDYPATAPIILNDLTIAGVTRKVLMHAPKNGFFYVLDRKTGELLSAKNFAPVNWATHIDLKTGRPALSPAADYSKGPKLIYPFTGGAHSWQPMAFNPQTKLVYIPVAEASVVLFDPSEGHEYRAGQRNTSTYGMAPNGVVNGAPRMDTKLVAALRSPDLWKDSPPTRSVLRAWDPVAQSMRWEVAGPDAFDRSGVMTTAGALVVQGTNTGMLNLYDADDGTLLKQIDVGTSIVAAPATYAIDDEQYIVVMAGIGGGPLAFSPPPSSAAYKYGNQGRIIALKLDGGPVPRPEPLPPEPPFPQPPPPAGSKEMIALGGELFGENCIRCHSNSVAKPRTATADLRRMSPATHAAFNDILLNGSLRPLGMPQWDDILSERDVEAIHQFLIAQSWDAYRKQGSRTDGTSPGL